MAFSTCSTRREALHTKTRGGDKGGQLSTASRAGWHLNERSPSKGKAWRRHKEMTIPLLHVRARSGTYFLSTRGLKGPLRLMALATSSCPASMTSAWLPRLHTHRRQHHTHILISDQAHNHPGSFLRVTEL